MVATIQLGVLYLVVGIGCAAALVVQTGEMRGHTTDVALLMVLWPLYGPFILSKPAQVSPGRRQNEFVEALRRAEGTPLASLLPPAAAAVGLGQRVEAAEHRVVEIETLLLNPEFDEATADNRSKELQAKGESLAASIAAHRVQNIRRLKQLRDRFSRELVEIRELVAQLRLQAELVRLAGAADGGSREVVQLLLARVEGLGAILDEEGSNGPPLPPAARPDADSTTVANTARTPSHPTTPPETLDGHR
jgi:hypothetical protein